MDKIISNAGLQQNRSYVLEGLKLGKKLSISRDTIDLDDDSCSDSDDKVTQYQLLEMQRRKKHFDEFRLLYNNKLEEKEAKRKREEEEQMDDFMQHPISKLLSKYGFKVPRPKSSSNQVTHVSKDSKNSISTSRYRVRSRSKSRSGILKDSSRSIQSTVSWSDLEIVDIFQRNRPMKDIEIREEEENHLKPLIQEIKKEKHVKISTDNLVAERDTSDGFGHKREDSTGKKLREEIAELEDRFNCILSSFKKTFPRQNRTQFTVKSYEPDEK